MSLLRPLLRPRGLRIPTTPFRSQPTRLASTSSPATGGPSRARNVIVGTALGVGGVFAYLNLTDSRSSFHQYVVVPGVRLLCANDPEGAHKVSLMSLNALYELGMGLRDRGGMKGLEGLDNDLFGYHIESPVALSAGLDKHGECIDPLLTLSPAISILEIGCVTPKPQEGNPKPRLFRLTTSESLINRYGFNSIGADAVASRLRARVMKYAIKHHLSERDVLDGVNPTGTSPLPASLHDGKLLAVQIGKNKSTPAEDMEAVKADYLYCVSKLGRYADFLVVNVSSPNTPGLRSLQKFEPLSQLLSAVVGSAQNVDRARKPPVVVKVSPDADSDEDIRGVCMAIAASGVKGVIVANTTVSRPDYITSAPKTTAEEKRIAAEEMGGYSGPALKGKMVELVGRYRKELDSMGGHEVVVFASGGITNGQDAYDAIKAGADVVMGYTSMVYKGVGWGGNVARGLNEIAHKEAEKSANARR